MKNVVQYLHEYGCPDEIAAAGLTGLVVAWERIAEDVSDGYPLGFDDLLNELDTRQIIADVLDRFPEEASDALRARLNDADAVMRAALQPIRECVWGDEVAEDEGWTPEFNWWYFGLPRKRGPLLQEDIENEGFESG